MHLKNTKIGKNQDEQKVLYFAIVGEKGECKQKRHRAI